MVPPIFSAVRFSVVGQLHAYAVVFMFAKPSNNSLSLLTDLSDYRRSKHYFIYKVKCYDVTPFDVRQAWSILIISGFAHTQ